MKGEKGPVAWRIFAKALIHCLIISLVVLGAPLPPVPRFLPESIRGPLQMAKEAIESVTDTSEADALIEQVRRVQYIDHTAGDYPLSIATGDSSAVATIPVATNMDTTFVIGGGAFSAGGGEQRIVSVRHLDPTSILFFKGTGKAGAGNLWWQAVDFGQGLTVQKGAASLLAGGSTVAVGLVTPVDKDKSFSLVSRLMGGQNVSINGSNVSAILTDPGSTGQWTHITVTRVDTAGSLVAEWQVVTFDDSTNVTVQHAAFSITSGATATPTIDCNPITQCFAVVTATGSSTNTYFVDAVVTNSTTLTLTRAATTGTTTGYWYLVKMPDGASVQRNRTAISSTTDTVNLTTPVKESESFTIYSVSSAGTHDVAEVGVELWRNGGNSSLSIYRNTAGAANVAWQVVTMPAIRVLSPNGGEVWTVGDTENITWTAASTMANVKITYDIDGNWGTTGDTYNIAESEGTPNDGVVTNDGLFAWSVPDHLSSNAKTVMLRIADSAAPTTRYDDTNAGFEIEGSVNLTQPVGGEPWLIADTEQIKWTYTGTIGNVKLVYDKESGGQTPAPYPESSPNQVIATVPASGQVGCAPAPCYNWYLAEELASATLRVKIYDTDDTDVVDYSTSDFSVSPNIQLVKPLNTYEWPVGRTRTVEWSSNGSGTTFNLYYSSTGSGGPWGTPINGGSPISGYDCSGNFCYDWAIPSDTPQSVVGSMKVEWGDDDDVYDIGPDTGNFSIVESVALDNPQTTTYLRALQNTNVEWSDPAGAGLGTVSLWYTTTWSTCQNLETDDESECWVGMLDATGLTVDDSPYVWNVPDIINPGTDVGIRVEEESNPTTVFDKKGSYKVKGLITVTEPLEYDVVRVGSTKDIKWDAFGSIGQVYIYMEKGGGGYNVEIVGPTPMWSNISGCQAVTVDASDELFVWGAPNYFKDAACTGGNQVWPDGVPDERNAVCTIKVYRVGPPNEDNPATGAAGISDAFVVTGALSNVVLDPTVIPISTTTTVTWDSMPANWSASVVLEYTNDNGGHWYPVNPINLNPQTTTAASGAAGHIWTVPNEEELFGTGLKLRVTQNPDPDDTSSLSEGFEVTGTLTLTGDATNADGLTVWEISDQPAITWNALGAGIGNVNIVYSLNGSTFPTPSQLLAVKDASQGASGYTWCVGYEDTGCGVDESNSTSDIGHDPDLVIGSLDEHTNVWIRVVNGDGSIKSTSANPITIRKKFSNVTTAAVWTVGTTGTISWDTYGYLPGEVNLFYDTQGASSTFPPQNQIGGDEVDLTGDYDWYPVTDIIGTLTRVQVRSSTISDVNKSRATNFTVKGAVELTAPVSTVTYVIGTTISGGGIKYIKHGNIGPLKIIYWIDSDSEVIEPAATGSSNYEYAIPATIAGVNVIDVNPNSKRSKIEIVGVTHEGHPVLEASDISDNFQVRGNIYDIEPGFTNGGGTGEVYTLGTTTYVKWKTAGNIGNVNIKLTLDDEEDGYTGMTPVTVAHNYNGGAGPGSWLWNIPVDIPSAGARIRVESVDNPADDTDPGLRTHDESNYTFKLRGSVNVTAPASGTEFHVNDTITIQWNTGGTNIGDVAINLYYDDDEELSKVKPISGSYSGSPLVQYKLPTDTVAEYAIVRVTSNIDPGVTDDSGAPGTFFGINPVLKLTLPNDNLEDVVVGSDYTIEWDPPDGAVSDVYIYVSTNGGKGVDGIAGGVNGADDFPSNYPPTLVAKGGMVTASAIGIGAGEYEWNVHDIMTNEAVIRICRAGDNDVEACDDSDNYFYIQGSITNVHVKDTAGSPAPETPIDLPVALTKHITWNSTGSLGTVNVYYSINADQGAGTTWTAIDSPPNSVSCQNIAVGSTSCAWDIPSPPSTKVRVRVRSVPGAWQQVQGISPANDELPDTDNGLYNEIIGSIEQVTVIDGGDGTDVILGGNSTDGNAAVIQFKQNGGITNFKIEYDINNSGSWQNITIDNAVNGPYDKNGDSIADGTITQNGQYLRWTWDPVPTTITPSNNIDFKISDFANAGKVTCESEDPVCTPGGDAGYVIKGQLSLVTPDAALIYSINDTIEITWNQIGPIGNKEIYYTAVDDFSDALTAINSNFYADGDGQKSYGPTKWKAPFKVSEEYRIKIRNNTAVSETQLEDVSEVMFAVRPKFNSISSPTGTPTWYVGHTALIEWTATSAKKP
ncbi:MAG: hypothetical protein JW847_04710, partial [Candidatus Omnitrophica bacterium]|nr:hypothetical protein [Candidatus Omnitrophota bacterium]